LTNRRRTVSHLSGAMDNCTIPLPQAGPETTTSSRATSHATLHPWQRRAGRGHPRPAGVPAVRVNLERAIHTITQCCTGITIWSGHSDRNLVARAETRPIGTAIDAHRGDPRVGALRRRTPPVRKSRNPQFAGLFFKRAVHRFEYGDLR
jgi:hypothetical protein